MSLTTLHGSNFLSDARGQIRRSRSWRPQAASAMPVEAHRIRSCRGPGGSLHRHAQFDATPTPIHSLNKPVLGLLPNRNYYFNHLRVAQVAVSLPNALSAALLLCSGVARPGYLGYSPAPELILFLADQLAVVFVDVLPAEYFFSSSDGQLGIA